LVGSALLVASLVPLWQYASLPRLFELQLHSATHITERIPAKQGGWEADQAPTANPDILDCSRKPGSRRSLPLPTATCFQSG
jgi:hypothetical protein